VLLRNEAEATVTFSFCAILHPKHRGKSTRGKAQGKSTGHPAGCLFASLWLQVVTTVSTSFSMSSVESMLAIDRMSNSNLDVLTGLNLK